MKTKFITHSLLTLSMVLSSVIVFNSCKKDKANGADSEKESIPKKDITSDPINKNMTARVPLYCSSVANPCADPACRPYFNCDNEVPTPPIYLENLFATYDTNVLKSPDSLEVIPYMVKRNQELINILSNNFPHTYYSSLDPNDEFVTWAGLVHMLAEGEGHFNNAAAMREARYSIDYGCVKGVLLGFFDVASLVEDYVHLIKSGGSWSTVRGLLWRTLKRYGGWMAAAGVIYDIATECF
jgi:hypothetical protein